MRDTQRKRCQLRVDGAQVSHRLHRTSLVLLRIATTCSACSNLRERVMRVLVRRLPNISTDGTQQKKPVRKSIIIAPDIGCYSYHQHTIISNIITLVFALLNISTTTVDCRSALIHAEGITVHILTPAAQQLGGALNILPSPFLWSWPLVEFRWIRRRLDLRALWEKLDRSRTLLLNCTSRLQLHTPPPLHIIVLPAGLSSASIRYPLIILTTSRPRVPNTSR